jgi:HD superfamily phosphohydrolase
MLHDVGHGPLSHTTEQVMPKLSQLKLSVYDGLKDRQANHEDLHFKIPFGLKHHECDQRQFRVHALSRRFANR